MTSIISRVNTLVTSHFGGGSKNTEHRSNTYSPPPPVDAVHDHIIIQGPMREPRTAKSYSCHTATVYGNLTVPKSLADEYAKARKYLQNAPGARSTLLQIEDGRTYNDQRISLELHNANTSPTVRRDQNQERQHLSKQFSKLLKALKTDPSLLPRVQAFRRGMKSQRQTMPKCVIPDTNENKAHVYWNAHGATMTLDGKGLSPALGLSHEFNHVIHIFADPKGYEERMSADDYEYDNLEEAFTINKERGDAIALGEGLRFDHRGAPYTVSGSTSRSTEYYPAVCVDYRTLSEYTLL